MRSLRRSGIASKYPCLHARAKNPIKLIFEVADVASERARLEALGVAMTPRPWGACDWADPEGNIFQICAAPGNGD